MRAAKYLQMVVGMAIVSMIGLGVGAAVAPLKAQEQVMLCMLEVSSCATTECLDFCNTYYPDWDRFTCTNGTCCNCYL